MKYFISFRIAREGYISFFYKYFTGSKYPDNITSTAGDVKHDSAVFLLIYSVIHGLCLNSIYTKFYCVWFSLELVFFTIEELCMIQNVVVHFLKILKHKDFVVHCSIYLWIKLFRAPFTSKFL